MARMVENGFYAAVADWLIDQEPGGPPWTLHPFLEHPEWREDNLKREPLPESYSKVYPVSGIWRVRRGRMSATTASGITSAFSLKYGKAELTAVQMCATYYGTAQFVGEDLQEEEGGIRITHPGRGWHYDSPGYFHPLGEPVDQTQWGEARWRRRFSAVPPLAMDLTVKEVQGGFDLRIVADGLDRVPLQIAWDFAPGGELDLDSGAVQGIAGQTAFLKSGYATYHVGGDAIAVGPGAYAHRMWQMRWSEQSPEAFRILITLLTPVDRTLEIRCGAWSEATEGILKSEGECSVPEIDRRNSAAESPGWHPSTGSGTGACTLSRSLSLSKGRRRVAKRGHFDKLNDHVSAREGTSTSSAQATQPDGMNRRRPVRAASRTQTGMNGDIFLGRDTRRQLGPIAGQLGKIEPIVALRSGEGRNRTGCRAVSASPDQVSRPVLFFGVSQDALGGPPRVNSVPTICYDFPAVRIFRPVVPLSGILDHIEKLAGLEFVIVVQLPRAAADHAGGLISKEADVLGEDLVGPVGNCPFATQETGEAPPQYIGQRRHTGQFQDRGSQVDEAHDSCVFSSLGQAPRPADDEGDAGGSVVETALPPHAVFAGHIAVVGAVNDDGPFGFRRGSDCIHDSADVSIEFRDQTVIGGQAPSVLFGRQFVHAPALPPSSHRGVEGVQIVRGNGFRDGDLFQVAVEHGSGTDEGVVG